MFRLEIHSKKVIEILHKRDKTTMIHPYFVYCEDDLSASVWELRITNKGTLWGQCNSASKEEGTHKPIRYV